MAFRGFPLLLFRLFSRLPHFRQWLSICHNLSFCVKTHIPTKLMTIGRFEQQLYFGPQIEKTHPESTRMSPLPFLKLPGCKKHHEPHGHRWVNLPLLHDSPAPPENGRDREKINGWMVGVIVDHNHLLTTSYFHIFSSSLFIIYISSCGVFVSKGTAQSSPHGHTEAELTASSGSGTGSGTIQSSRTSTSPTCTKSQAGIHWIQFHIISQHQRDLANRTWNWNKLKERREYIDFFSATTHNTRLFDQLWLPGCVLQLSPLLQKLPQQSRPNHLGDFFVYRICIIKNPNSVILYALQ